MKCLFLVLDFVKYIYQKKKYNFYSCVTETVYVSFFFMTHFLTDAT